MKRTLKTALFVAALVVFACNPESKQQLNIGNINPSSPLHIVIMGSETMRSIFKKEAEAFIECHPEYSFTIDCRGSVVGIDALINKKADLVLTSRDLKLQERQDLNKSYKKMCMDMVALDGLTVVVNANNTVEKLSIEQIGQVFSGRITNWSQLGGQDQRVIVYNRDKNSGSTAFFYEKVLISKGFSPDAKEINDNDEIVEKVKQHQGAIAFIGLGEVKKHTLKAIKIYDESGQGVIEPTFEALLQNQYPLARPLYYVYSQEVKNKLKPFIDFILSNEGQQIVLEEGYLPLYK